MDEFEFLDAMFHRLSEVRSFQSDAKTKGQKERSDAHGFAAVLIENSIRDYLKMKGGVK